MSLDDDFKAALQMEEARRGRGFQTWLAAKVEVSPQYIFNMLKGTRYGSESVRRKIAAALGYGYEEFLLMGGGALPPGELIPPEAADPPEIKELLKKTRTVLLSQYIDIKGALSSNIETFHRAVVDREAIHRLEVNAQAQNARLEALEKKDDQAPRGQNTGTEGRT